LKNDFKLLFIKKIFNELDFFLNLFFILKNITKIGYLIAFAAIFTTVSFTACIPLKSNDDPSNSTPTSENPWQLLTGGSTNRVIRSMRSTIFELQAVTDDQFLRFDRNFQLIEKRILQSDRLLFGSPVMTDNLFLRVSQGDNNRQILEFHVTKNAAVIRKIPVAELTNAAEAFEVDASGRLFAAFSDDGTKCFIYGKQTFPLQKPQVFILDIQMNVATTDIVGITVTKKVDIPNATTDRKIESVRFFGGNCYLATKEGGYRITPDGVITKLFGTYCLDFFVKNGRIYSTGFDVNQFYESLNNGLTFRTTGQNTTLKYVETAGAYAFSQNQRGFQFGVADSALTKPLQIVYNTAFPNNQFDIYNTVTYFENRYFINVNKDIFFQKEKVLSK
jgi:hypothetical protein